jgi:hypothetical protein
MAFMAVFMSVVLFSTSLLQMWLTSRLLVWKILELLVLNHLNKNFPVLELNGSPHNIFLDVAEKS